MIQEKRTTLFYTFIITPKIYKLFCTFLNRCFTITVNNSTFIMFT